MHELDFKPPCGCKECRLQYRYDSIFGHIAFAYIGDVEDVGARAASFSESIGQDRDYVRNVIHIHGVSILKKWRRNRQTRQALLQKAQPDIYVYRMPSLDLATRLAGVKGGMGDMRGKPMAYLAPYINLENLSEEPWKLIGLLYHRSNARPMEWVPFDNVIMQSAWSQGCLGEKSAEGCITMTGENFGKWKAFVADEVHRGDAYGSPRSLLLLETQHCVLAFLRKIVDVILGNVDSANTASKLANSPSNSMAHAMSDDRSTVTIDWLQYLDNEQRDNLSKISFGSAYAEQPFVAPPNFSIDVLVEIAEGQNNEAQDKLWLLQTDLDYFYERASYFEQRQFEAVSGLKELRPGTAKMKWDNVAYIMTIQVMAQARDWQYLLDECEIVKQECLRSKTDICTGWPLPARYERALGSLQMLLKRAASMQRMTLMRLILKSPAFQSKWKAVATGGDPILGMGLRGRLRGLLHPLQDRPCLLVSIPAD